jgi:hypothetical protein
MTTTTINPGQWVLVPDSPREIEAVVRHCRRLVTRRALFAAGVSMVPIPGVDWVTDVAVLMKLIPEINHAFGLTPEQVERLAPDRRLVVYKTLWAGSSRANSSSSCSSSWACA